DEDDVGIVRKPGDRDRLAIARVPAEMLRPTAARVLDPLSDIGGAVVEIELLARPDVAVQIGLRTAETIRSPLTPFGPTRIEVERIGIAAHGVAHQDG